MNEWLEPLLIVAFGYTVLGITGFGSALIIVPLLAWRWPLPEVVALTLLMDVPASVLHSGLNMRYVSTSEIRRLLPGMACGAIVGIGLTTWLLARWPLMLLGLYVVVVGVNALRTSRQAPQTASARWAHGAGFAVGLIEMMFGTAGPVVVAWLTRRLPDVQQMRASTPVVIVVGATIVLAGMGWTGRLSDGVLWHRWLMLAPAALFGVWCGNRVARFIPAARLRQIICGLLVLSGLMLIRHAWGLPAT